MTRLRFALLGAAALLTVSSPAFSASPAGAPSRAPVKGCAWERLSDASLGLAAWVQRCDFGHRRVDFTAAGGALAIRYSDGGAPEPVVEPLELQAGEPPEAGIRRHYAARTDAKVAGRCVLEPVAGPLPSGVKRYTFVPDATYRKELDLKANPDEVPEPPCGDWGVAPDGIQYFEAQPKTGARKVLFVRVGQDEPLFDEKTLRLLPAKGR